jgi:hypothetical protein
MAQRGFQRPYVNGENVLGMQRAPAGSVGAQALDLVYQASELFRSLEDRARVNEARAEAAERVHVDIVNAAERKLRDASHALEEAQKRIEAQQQQLSAIEYRAQSAEADAREARQTLALVEDAIRRRLLLTVEQTESRPSAVA